MLTLPPAMLTLLAPFAPLFRRRVWPSALVLVAGTLLAPGKRTVTAALRVMGLAQARRFERYHRVLNRAQWSSLAVSRVLLGLLVAAFAPTGPLLLGIDETIERRRGKRIAAKGIYRDPVRSSHEHFVKASGLRWLCLMLLVPVPWAGRVWALPFLTALAPSERYDRERGRRHKRLVDWARQLLLVVRRLEVTFEEARRHLGVETQRQWSDLAIRRTTPVLLGLFSLVTLLTDRSVSQTPVRVRQAAWYPKAQPPFADALALIRRELGAQAALPLSVSEPDLVKVPRRFVECLTETLCYAA